MALASGSLFVIQRRRRIGVASSPMGTSRYFGNPIYQYSLRQGIDDGFLASYRVHRIITTWDAAGWRPSQGELDRYGREIPDGEYTTKDFKRAVALKARTEAVARNLAEFMQWSGQEEPKRSWRASASARPSSRPIAGAIGPPKMTASPATS